MDIPSETLANKWLESESLQNLVDKTLAVKGKSTKSTKVFSRQSFALHGIGEKYI